jgi:hypothetical protein
MYDIASRLFLSLFLVGYSVFLIALAWWALSARLGPAAKSRVASALVHVLKGFHHEVWPLKRDGLKSSRNTSSSFGRS